MKLTLSKSELVYLWIVIGLCFAFSITNDSVWQAVILMTVLNLTIAGVFIAAIRLKTVQRNPNGMIGFAAHAGWRKARHPSRRALGALRGFDDLFVGHASFSVHVLESP